MTTGQGVKKITEKTRQVMQKSLCFEEKGETLSIEITLDNISPQIDAGTICSFLKTMFERMLKELDLKHIDNGIGRMQELNLAKAHTCISYHIQAFQRQASNDKVADMAEAREHCIYNRGCDFKWYHYISSAIPETRYHFTLAEDC